MAPLNSRCRGVLRLFLLQDFCLGQLPGYLVSHVLHKIGLPMNVP